MENYYVKENKKGYSSPCCNYGSSSSSSKNLEAINLMSLNGKDKNDWPPSNEKEHMFDKVVTPSDVGKLNRLVIPKQHAEKYFPLEASANEKGLFLYFRDRNGKPWRFRYSYWNSSQSYVMTKGWSRFVKDKKLDPGDVVSFIRSVRGSDMMYIDWRRRLPPLQTSFWGGRGRFYATTTPLMAIPHFRVNPYRFPRQYYHHRGGIRPAVVIDSVPLTKHHHHQYVKTVRPTSNKRLRLFGVNMELSSTTTTTTMQEEDGESDQQCQILSSRVASLPPHQQHLASSSPSISHHQQALESRLSNLWSYPAF